MRLGYTTLRALSDAGDAHASHLLRNWLGRGDVQVWALRGHLHVWRAGE